MTLLVLFFFGREVVHGFRSLTFPQTTGRIRNSSIEEHSDGEGTDYTPEIVYEYKVNGREYVGKRLFFGLANFSDRYSAVEAVEQHPAGSAVQVFYDAGNPSDSGLIPGLAGASLYCSIFVMPFTVIAIGFWVIMYQGAVVARRAAGGVRIIEEPTAIRAQLPHLSAVAAGMAAFGGISFILCFIVSLPIFRHRSMLAGGAVLGLILVGTAAVVIRRRQRLADGFDDLVIDRGIDIIRLPLNGKTKTRSEFPLAEVKAISVKEIHPASSDYASTWAVDLQLHSGEREQVVAWYSSEKAENFAAWLRAELGLDNSSFLETAGQPSAGAQAQTL